MLIVQKYGGTSVGSIERIRHVARRVLNTQRAGHQVVVVSSAMSGETDRLIKLAHEMGATPNPRELDAMIATGETVASALLAQAIELEGGKARSYQGHQIPIYTDPMHTRARVHHIDSSKLHQAIKEGIIPVVTGFQGIGPDGSITTLGRGGSDTSAVAVAAALKADVCEIYTDVDGVYTIDPNLCKDARKISRISFDEMMELAAMGAKVLQIRSVEIAALHNVPIHVRSTFSEQEGTMVVKSDETLEKIFVSGVGLDKNQAHFNVRGLPWRPTIQSELFKTLAQSGISVDMIVQNWPSRGVINVAFTVPRSDNAATLQKVQTFVDSVGAESVTNHTDVVKVSIVGVGMHSHAGVAQKMFELLAEKEIEILMIGTSEIKVSCLIPEKHGQLAAEALHTGFKLGENA